MGGEFSTVTDLKNFKSEGREIRYIKTQGLKKINGYCPAQIVFCKDKKSFYYPIEVTFLRTHVGHNNKLCHVTLSPNTKQEIASKLLNKVPTDAIIDEVRNSVV